ncbi:hypothetical protein Ddye_015533 [Dipteronia dyeriana]|uniref:ABC1 atypical kinase-like domain-containing protein n=1 Tax=Dipteronia dyeriana TaxID=168575 RepID=A0AAD9WXZ4_9ROSI|nr:hypothetical protein Ddye_015533 [Dipteronia dyeriana]
MQILKNGFFHADPHPGNLAVDVDELLIYYDFGMMGEVQSFTREKLLQFFYAAYEKDAGKARSSTMSMPYRVQRIKEFVKQLEAGDIKLRVRVLESERAARKATMLQMATMHAVFGGTLLTLGVTFSSQGSQGGFVYTVYGVNAESEEA